MGVSQEVLSILVRLEGKAAFIAGAREEQAAIAGYTAEQRRAAASSDELAAAQKRQAGAVTLVHRAQTALGLAVLGAAVESVKAAIHWNDLGKTISQQTGLVGRDLEDMMGVIMRSAQHTPYAINEVADAAVLLKTKFGLTDTQIEKTAGLMAAFAQRAGVDTKAGTTTLLSILQDYREPLNTVVSLSDKLIAVSQATQKPMGDLLNVIEKYGPKLQAMGFGLNETIKMLGVFQASGISTNMMGRGLSAALTKAAKEHEATGESIPTIIQRHIREVSKAQTAQESLSLALQYFGAQVGPTFSKALFQNEKALQGVEHAMGKTGATSQVFRAQQKEVAGQWQELRNQLFKYEVEMGEKMIPILKTGVKDLMKLAEAIMAVTDNGKLLIPLTAAFLAYKGVMIGVTAVTAVYEAISAAIAATAAAETLGIEGVAGAVFMLGVALDTIGIGLIILAITALVFALYMLITHFHDVERVAGKVWRFIRDGAVDAAKWVAKEWGKLEYVLTHPFDFLWAKAKWVFDHVKKEAKGIPGTVLGSVPIVGGPARSLLHAVGIPGFAEGGVMPWQGYAVINEREQGETVWLPGGATVQPSPASSLGAPRAHTPTPAPRPQPTSHKLEAVLVMPNGDVLAELVTKSLTVSRSRL